MSSHTTQRSLRTVLFLRLGPPFLAAVVLPGALSGLWPHLTGFSLALAVAVDVLLISGYTRLVLRSVVVEPLHALSRAADDIGANDLTRRMPASRLRELQALSATFDRLTSRVLADQAQLIRAEKLASIGRLSASVAHEIGNPLGAMLGHVHLLRKQLLRRAAPSEDLELLAAMERESARIERIVRGLLDYARARPPLPSAVDIHGVIRSTVELLRSQGALERIDVTLELTDSPLVIDGQRHDLEQLFVNLILNAADAMNGRGRIVVRLERAARFTLREPATRRSEAANDGVIAHPPSSRAQQWLEGNDSAEVARIVIADSGPCSRRTRRAHLRPVLHDEAEREGDGSRPRHRRPHRRQLSRCHLGDHRSRRRCRLPRALPNGGRIDAQWAFSDRWQTPPYAARLPRSHRETLSEWLPRRRGENITTATER